MGFVDRLTGKSQAKAIEKGADLQFQAGEEASALLDPFQAIGQQGLDQAGFLTDPQAQFDFLQSNPLFQYGLDAGQNALTGITQSAAARGRLSAGDTATNLQDQGFRNALLAAQPLISEQKASIGDLLNFGQSTALNQGNLRTGQAAAQAGGLIGSANARSQGAQNILDFGTKVAGQIAASDPSLKENITKIDEINGFNVYSWDWNSKANSFGLYGSSKGVMADEVNLSSPDAVIDNGDYLMVDYSKIGVEV